VSQQINLYDPALLRRRDLLTATRLAAVAALIAVVVIGWGIWERTRLGALEQEADLLAAENKSLQDEIAAAGARRTGLKADAAVAAELSGSKELLAFRREAMEKLKTMMRPQTPRLADYLTALARQTPAGLWLTGFSVASGEAGMEISGRMTDPTLLPEFIRRLNSETAFFGRSFAALQVNAAKPASAPAGQGQAPAPVLATVPPFHEFSLAPAKVKP
jgi:hypothetical protein